MVLDIYYGVINWKALLRIRKSWYFIDAVVMIYYFNNYYSWVSGNLPKNRKKMNEYKEIENLLNIVKSRIDTHNEFKKEYDKQLAFDFSLFNFFSIGENKVSQILAYFLDEKQNHGQGNLFLNKFVDTFYKKEVDSYFKKYELNNWYIIN